MLLIADEVICGFGRTGNMFGSETFGLKPDMVTMAKAALVRLSADLGDRGLRGDLSGAGEAERQNRRVRPWLHLFRASGRRAVALETLKIYEERDILDHVRAVMPHFQERLRQLERHPLVGEARGMGLIGAIELVEDKQSKKSFEPAVAAAPLAAELALDNGLIVRAAGDALAVCPPLIIEDAEIDQLFDRLASTLDQTHAELRRRGVV